MASDKPEALDGRTALSARLTWGIDLPARAAATVRTTLALHRQTARQWVGRHYRDGDNMTIAYTDEIGIAICTRIIEGLTIKEIWVLYK